MSTSRPPAPAGLDGAAVRALAREVADLRATVDHLAQQSGAAGEAAAAAMQAVKALTGAVERISTTGGPAGEDGVTPPAGSGEPAPPWWTVHDSDEARGRLADLAAWIKAVYVRYPDHGLIECWPYHQDVVTELLTLRDTWHEVYYGQHASPQAVSDWHDRYRPGTALRVEKALRGCRLDKHKQGAVENPWERPRTPGGDLVDVLAGWWAETQGQTEPPSPPGDVVAGEDATREDRRRRRGY